MAAFDPPRITVATLEFQYEAEARLELPEYAGSTLRSALGRSLREAACVTGAKRCDGCPFVVGCPYGALWELRRSDVPSGFGNPPVAIVFRSPYPGTARQIARGERFTFELHVFGAARLQLPLLVHAARYAGLGGLGELRAPARLCSAHVVGLRRQRIYQAGAGLQRFDANDGRWVGPTRVDRETARLVLRTPLTLRVTVNGRRRTLDRFHAGEFFRRVTGRIASLARVHQALDFDWDYKRVNAEADAVRVRMEDTRLLEYRRESKRGGAHGVPMRGLVGEVALSGLSPRIAGLLKVAEEIHVGSDTRFGFGQIEVAG